MKNKFYLEQSIYSDPGKFGKWYDPFSNDISAMTLQIQNLFMHYADINLFSVSIAETRFNELNLRTIAKSLQTILSDDHELTLTRPPEKRIMGVCRDTSLLLCSVLRSRGIAARLRSGFVNYFIPGLFLDGFCVEFFDESLQRWRSIDTRTTQLHIDHYKLSIDFDLMNVPNTRFISAANAWRMCRFENADPVRFGSRQHRGLFTVRNRLIQDLALLNKQEMLIWDLWGPMLTTSVTDYYLLDELADLLLHHDNTIEKINEFYNHHLQFKVPNTILVDNPFLTAEWVTL